MVILLTPTPLPQTNTQSHSQQHKREHYEDMHASTVMARPWCFYHVQGEEGESADEPNAFILPPINTNGHVTLKHFLAAFPLTNKQGSDHRVYHARFKVKDKACGFAWQDVQDAQAPLPFFQGAVHAKILRLDQVPKPTSRLRRKPLISVAEGSGGGGQQRSAATASSGIGVKPPSTYVAPPNPPSPRHQQSSSSRTAARPAPPSSAPSPSIRTASPTPPNGPARGISGNSNTSSHGSSGAGEGGGRGSASAFAPPSPSQGPVKASSSAGGDDLDSFLYGGGSSSSCNGDSIPGPRQQHQPQRPPPANGLSPMRSSPPPTTCVSTPPSSARANSSSPAARPSPPLSAGMAGLDIDDDDDTPPPSSSTTSTTSISNNNNNSSRSSTPIPPFPSANATPEELFFMQPTGVKQAEAAKDEQEHDALRHKLLPRLDAWARDPPQAGGKLRNVRTLLSTMHTVLWPGCVNWKPVFLGDLMAPDRVKFHYRKAMLVVHPDKNVNGSAEQRFVAEKLFTSVNEAYTVFAAQEMK